MTTDIRAALLAACFTVAAMVSTQTPPLFPPTFPAAHIPVWWALAAVCGLLTVLLVLRPDRHRAAKLVLGWGGLVLALVQAFVIGDVTAMFGTWLLVPALALVSGPLKPRPRKALVAAHTVASAIWVGIAATFVAMAVVALTSADDATSTAVYEVMALFDVTLLPWANFATVLTGLALSVATKWGLFRYYWVVAKILVAVGILIMAFGFLHARLEMAAATLSGGDTVVRGFTFALCGLIAATLLSLYKPGGRIRRVRPGRSPATRWPRRHRSP